MASDPNERQAIEQLEKEILDWLERTKDTVRAYQDETPDNQQFPMHRPYPDSAATGLIALLKKHPVYCQQKNRWFRWKYLHHNPHHAAPGLLNKTQQVGAVAAMEWLAKVYGVARADVRNVAEVIGIRMTQPYEVCNAVRFMSVEHLPKSVTSDAYKRAPTQRAGFMDLPLAVVMAVYEEKDVPVTKHAPRECLFVGRSSKPLPLTYFLARIQRPLWASRGGSLLTLTWSMLTSRCFPQPYRLSTARYRTGVT
jgi:hypothetical protein